MCDLKAQQRTRFLAPRRAAVGLCREIAEHVTRLRFFRAAGGALLCSTVGNEVGTDAVRGTGRASGKLEYYGRTLRRATGRELACVGLGQALNRSACGTHKPTDDGAFCGQGERRCWGFSPRVAFDPSGARLRRGPGYDDPTPRRLHPSGDILRLVFETQLTSSMPRDADDGPLGFAATELAVLCCTEACYPRMSGRSD
jgi:5-formyltetrahydrofolate cyclo-ligase